MHWEDLGWILSTQKHGENAHLITLFTKNHGVRRGYFRSFSRKQVSNVQLGNLVYAKWKARTANQLGSFDLELVRPLPWTVIDNAMLLKVVMLTTILLRDSLLECEPQPEIFAQIEALFDQLKEADWLRDYIKLELKLLQYSGFGLSLKKCAVTGESHNLQYISPKTGAAVSEGAGQEYRDKLFPYSPLLADPNSYYFTKEELDEALRITGFFINKFIYRPKGKTLPNLRQQIIEKITHEHPEPAY